MSSLSEKQWIYFMLSFFSCCFLIFYPKMLLILDEYSYFNQALALSSGNTLLTIQELTSSEYLNLTGSPYLPGTAIVLAFLIKIFGNSGAFLLGASCFIISVLLTLRIFKKLALNPLGILLFFVFPPLLMLTRTVMSGMPSLLIVTWFLYLFICKPASKKLYIQLAIIAGLGTLFRETNIVILGIFLFFLFLQKKKWIGYLALPFILTIALRLAISFWIIGKATYVSGADPFSIFNVIPNLPLYLILTIILIPFGLIFLAKYKGKYHKEIQISTSLFLIVYLLYGFNPIEYSGWGKGLLFGGRFLVPTIPLFAIAIGFGMNQYSLFQKKYIKYLMVGLSIFCISFSQFAGYKFNKTHHDISDQLYKDYFDLPIVIDHSGFTSINRYINPLLGIFPKQSDLNKFHDKKYVENVFEHQDKVFIILSMRFENQEKLDRGDKYLQLINDLKVNYKLLEEQRLQSFDGTTVQVWSMEQKEASIDKI